MINENSSTYLNEIQKFGEYIFDFVNKDFQGNPRNLLESWYLGEIWGDVVVSIGLFKNVRLNFTDTIGNYFYLRLIDNMQYQPTKAESNGKYSSCGTEAFELVMPMKMVLITTGYDVGYLEILFRQAISSYDCAYLSKFEPSTVYNFLSELQESGKESLDKVNLDKVNITSFELNLNVLQNPSNLSKYCEIPICEPCEIGRPYKNITHVNSESQLKK